MAIFLGIDCGATHLRIGLVSETGELISSKITNSPLRHQPENLARIVKDNLGGIGKIEEIGGIGIGVPGPLDMEHGLILSSSNLANVAPINIVSQFERVFNKKVYLDRDTIVGLIGEAWQGGAVDCKDVIMLTLGTGVGGAIMEGGEIERGADGRAGEIGHMYLGIDGFTRSEVLASPTRSAQTVEKLRPLDLRGSIHKCGLGHVNCFEALMHSTEDLDELGTILGYALASIVDIFNPEKIIIGGGMIKKGNFLTKAIEVMKQVGMKPAVDTAQVEYAKLKDMAGVMGAAKLAMDNDNHQNTQRVN